MTDNVHDVVEATLASLCTALGLGGAAIILIDLEGDPVLMDEIHATETIGQITHRAIAALIKELDIDPNELDVEEITVPAPKGPQIVH
jgi:hypothetical protein